VSSKGRLTIPFTAHVTVAVPGALPTALMLKVESERSSTPTKVVPVATPKVSGAGPCTTSGTSVPSAYLGVQVRKILQPTCSTCGSVETHFAAVPSVPTLKTDT